MKSLVIYLLAGTAMLCPMNGSSEESAPSTPPPVKDPKDDFLPDMDFCSMVFQDISSKPIVWNDDRSLAVIYDETASGVLCYTFWCVKETHREGWFPLPSMQSGQIFPKRNPAGRKRANRRAGKYQVAKGRNDDDQPLFSVYDSPGTNIFHTKRKRAPERREE